MEGGESSLSAKSEVDEPKQSKKLSESMKENLKRRDIDLNEDATNSDSDQLTDSTGGETGIEQVNSLSRGDHSENGRKDEYESERLVGDEMERSTNGDDMKDGIKMRRKKKVKLEVPDGILFTPRVLRSSSAAREDQKRSDSKENQHGVAVDDERKGDNKGQTSCMDSSMKRKRGRPPKVKETCVADGTSGTKLAHKDSRSYDEDEIIEPQDKQQQFKPKRGRPPKLRTSNLSEHDLSKLNYKLVSPPNLQSQQSDIDGLNTRPKRGRPPKMRENAEALCVRGKKMKLKHGTAPKVVNRNIDESGDEVKKLKNSCKGMPLSPEYDGCERRGRKKMIRKRGRPPKAQKKNGSENEYVGLKYRCEKEPEVHWSDRSTSPLGDKLKMKLLSTSQDDGTDDSDSKAKKRPKLHNRFSELQGSNCSNDGGSQGEGEQKIVHNGPGKQSKSSAKKLLRDRIVQLLLAAGWTLQYRPRNGKDYNDAVYVNPEGKTHWSVTLAYKVYKEQAEHCMNDQKNSTAGSDFALLSEEEICILERKTQKERGDKGKKRPKKLKDGDTAQDLVGTTRLGKQKLHIKKLQRKRLRMQKQKLSARYRVSSLKKKLKGSCESQNLECKSPSRLSDSTRKQKREGKHNRKRCAPLARSSLEGADSKDDGYTLYEGKRTVLGWMIDSDIVSLNRKVQCMNSRKTKVLLEGIITKEGIQCDCCNKVFSISDFEIHAGSKLNQPFKSLYLEGGNSLLHCLLESWNKQDESQLKGFHVVDVSGGDPNDDTCGICGDGGDLICCDGCPSTFHQGCLDVKKFPSGAWFCGYCSCKFCGEVKAAKDDHAFLSPLLSCCSCEEKYHQGCTRENGTAVNDRSDHSFCSKNCQELFEGLLLLIGVKQPLPEGFSWTFLRRFDLAREVSACEVSEKIECNSKLAVAFSIMDECFSPLADHRTGINLLQNIVYNFGSNFNRLNYSGFLTAILERDDEIIAVASIRIHGNQLAEMPFIGTRYMYRRQGMCRRLMSGIESALGYLKVEKLVIPAVPEMTETWTSVFGFKPVKESSKKTIKNLNLLVFPGVDMLEKPLLKHNNAEPSVLPSNGHQPLVLETCQHMDIKANKSEEKCSELDVGFTGQEPAGNVQNRNSGTADVESPSRVGDRWSGLKRDMEVERSTGMESNPQSLNCCVEDKDGMAKVTDKDIEYHSQAVENCVGDVGNETDIERKKNSDIETSSPVSDSCNGGKSDLELERNKVLQIGCGSKELARSVADGEPEEALDRKTPVSILQTEERSECHTATIPCQTDTKTLENIVGEPKIHRFVCHIV